MRTAEIHRRYYRVNCAGESNLAIGKKIIHAKLINVSMTGFSVLADQRTQLYNLFEGVLVIRKLSTPIWFRACSVQVEGKVRDGSAHRFKIGFSFLGLAPKSKDALSAFITSSVCSSVMVR